VTTEFGAQPRVYWDNAIRRGLITVNGISVSCDYVVQNSDKIVHKTHRHEPPIAGEIILIGETDELVAISKPASLPMHPCGAYKYNSLTSILQYEPVVPNQASLSLVHRLDRYNMS
jgi:23S rRNA-/tRNA-specific pseudouridylate synthase